MQVLNSPAAVSFMIGCRQTTNSHWKSASGKAPGNRNKSEERHQYEFHVDQYTPKIEYIKSTNGEIYLTHTEVPTQLGGKGIGSQLVEKALKDIEKQGLRLVPLCPFVAGYIHKHPEWKRIVMKGIHIQ